MPAWLLPLAAAGISGVTSALGQKSANDANIKIAREQMAFQKEMSDTTVQRRMSDLEAAGINPILAGEMSASSPAGASATMQNVAGTGISSARSSATATKQFQLVEQQLRLSKEATRKMSAEAFTSESNQRIAKNRQRMDQMETGFYIGEDFLEKPAMKQLLQSLHNQRIASSAQSVSQANLTRLSIPEQRAIAMFYDAVPGAKGAQELLSPLMQLLRMRGSATSSAARLDASRLRFPRPRMRGR